MDMQSIIDTVSSFDGALAVQPQPGDEFPELSWGDTYFYYAPDRTMPTRTQPYGTIVTKNYPDDTASNLDGPGRFRVNVNAGRSLVEQLDPDQDPSQVDIFLPHPLYATSGWVSVVNPAERTSEHLVSQLRRAHQAARAKADRCSSFGGAP